MVQNVTGEIEAVRALMVDTVRDSSVGSLADDLQPFLGTGKMLRGRLALTLGSATGVLEQHRLICAAAIELAHLASLLHDDVIDNGLLRRGNLAMWAAKGTAGAVLMGDYLVCRSFSFIAQLANTDLLNTWIRLLQDVCDAELEQELILADERADWARCMSMARRKTGSLFAFSAYSAATHEPGLAALLLESGFELGTAYQLADDLLDSRGDEEASDKTLGQDALQNKLTAASFVDDAGVDPVYEISVLLDSAQKRLYGYQDISDCWFEYIQNCFQPIVNEFASVGLQHGLTTGN